MGLLAVEHKEGNLSLLRDKTKRKLLEIRLLLKNIEIMETCNYFHLDPFFTFRSTAQVLLGAAGWLTSVGSAGGFIFIVTPSLTFQHDPPFAGASECMVDDLYAA